VLYWEDFAPDRVAEYGPRLVTREEIITFAAEFDPQPLHLDEDAARAGMLGGLSASRWHSCCLVMRMSTDGLFGRTASPAPRRSRRCAGSLHCGRAKT